MHRRQVIASCPACGDDVPVCCHVPCHGIHLLLSLATKGMWVVVWILLAVHACRCRCSLCGRRLWIAGFRPNAQDPALAIPWIDRRAGGGHPSPRNRFNQYLVENGLVYYAPTHR